MPGRVLALQRLAGNAATTALLQRPPQVQRACCASCAGGGSCESEDKPVQRQPIVQRAAQLMLGSKGDSVSRLQEELNDHGSAIPPLSTDGYFGSMTLEAVIAFQTSTGLVPDGIAGPLTLQALGSGQGSQSKERVDPTEASEPFETTSWSGAGSATSSWNGGWSGAGSGWTSGGTAEAGSTGPSSDGNGVGSGWTSGGTAQDASDGPPPNEGGSSSPSDARGDEGAGEEGEDPCSAGARKVRLDCIQKKEIGCALGKFLLEAAGTSKSEVATADVVCKAAMNKHCFNEVEEYLNSCRHPAKKGIKKWWEGSKK